MSLPESNENTLSEHVVNLKDCISFVTKDGSRIRELLSHRNSPIANQSLAEATIGPGITTEAHFHRTTEEIYFIVSGSGIMRLGPNSQRVDVGDAIAIPPGVVHSISNDSARDLVLLCCCAPAYEHDDTFLV